jgi:hypothetical protein
MYFYGVPCQPEGCFHVIFADIEIPAHARIGQDDDGIIDKRLEDIDTYVLDDFLMDAFLKRLNDRLEVAFNLFQID